MSSESPHEILRQKYCPPLDESLFIVLAGDYDLENEESKRQLEAILDDLKEQAVVEQELELAVPPQIAALQAEQDVGSSQTASRTTTTDLGENIDSITTGLSDLHASSETAYEPELPQGLESGTLAEKEKWLTILFPTIEAVQITETISRCDGDVQRSIDELLNLSFIHDDIDENYTPPPVLKSIDGFADGTKSSNSKRMGRRKKDKGVPQIDVSSLDAPKSSNVWQNTTHDVDFIVSRTNLPIANVTSLYHKNNNNLALTIRMLVKKEAELHADVIRENEIIQFQAAEIKLDLEEVSDKSIFGALLLARMMPSAAKELLEAMMQKPGDDEVHTGKLIGIAQYTPINLSEDEAPSRKVRTPTTPIGDAATLMTMAGIHSLHADRAFSQASSAHRRGRSDRLMGGAAAYYASVGHERRQRQKEIMHSAADAYVNQQSSSTVLDLHGVTVEQAVRLARTRVENWWEDLGDRKYVVGGIGNGYKIITGVGTHSVQGIGRIGPAVSKMLMSEGWKVNVQRGEIYVEGRARR